MSRISQDFINDLGFLYENIHVKDQDFLNEESEYYEEETAELTEDIILSLALTMFSEGYTAETFVKFLASSDEEVILEKYLNIDVNFISEEAVYNDFVEEQFELLEVAGLIKLLGRGAKAAASGIKAGVKATKSAVKTGVTKVASAGVEKRVSKQLIGRKGVDIAVPGSKTGRSGSSWDRTTAALEKLSKSKAKKAGIDVPSGKLDPRQSTELLKQARTAKAIQGLKTAAKGALIGGTGVLAGYLGAKLGSGGSGQQDAGKPTPSGTPSGTKGDDFLKGSALAKLGGREGRIKDGEFRTMKWSPESKARYDAATKGSATSTPAPAAPSSSGGGSSSSAKPAAKPAAKPSAPKKPEGGTAMQQWAKKYPELAAKVKPGQSGYEEISAMRDKPGPNEKQDQTPTTGKSEAQIDKSSVEADIKKEQERLKKKAEQTTTKESYDAYDVIIEYLIDTEQVDTLEEAHYVMLEMNEETIGNIIEQYENYLLAEEIEEWVNDLVEEGYDFSQYTWDDVVEYYVNELNNLG